MESIIEVLQKLVDEQSELQTKVAENVTRSTELCHLLTQSELKSKLKELKNLIRKEQDEIQVENQKLSEKRASIEQLEASTKIEVENQQKLLEERKIQIEKLSETLTKRSIALPNKIKLSIGGTIFVTTAVTLTSENETYFSGLLNEKFATKNDEDGEIFVDRDPKHFRVILNHLRGADVSKVIEAMSAPDRAELKDELNYYQIQSLLTQHFSEQQEAPHVEYSSDSSDDESSESW